MNTETETITKPKPKPKCILIGEDGNIYNLIGIASRCLKRAGMYDKAVELQKRLFEQHSYTEALALIGEYVEVR